METPKIYLVYPWETPPLFAKLLVSTYLGESHFVRAWWDYQEVIVVTLLVAMGLVISPKWLSLLWPWVATGSCGVNGGSSLLPNDCDSNGTRIWCHTRLLLLRPQQRRMVWWYHRGAHIETGYKMSVVKFGPPPSLQMCSVGGWPYFLF
jgi:hypothetical protein